MGAERGYLEIGCCFVVSEEKRIDDVKGEKKKSQGAGEARVWCGEELQICRDVFYPRGFDIDAMRVD